MWNQGYSSSFRETFELHDFPFDKQDLTIEMRQDDPRTWDVFDLRVHSVMFYKIALQLPEWSMCMPLVKRGSPAHKSTDVALQVVRRPQYYLRNIVSVVTMLSVMSLFSFAIPIKEISERINTIITLLLTTVAFKFVIGDSLPRVNYNTKLDKFMFKNMLFLFLVATTSTAGSIAADLSPEGAFDTSSTGLVNGTLFWTSFVIWLWGTVSWVIDGYKIHKAQHVEEGNSKLLVEVDGKNWYQCRYATPDFMPPLDPKL